MKNIFCLLLLMWPLLFNYGHAEEAHPKAVEAVYKTKLKTFNPRFIALERNKKTVREAALWAFIPCGGFIYLHDYSYMLLFGVYMLCMGGAFCYSLYRWWDVSKQGNGYSMLSYVYSTGGLLFLGYILNIIVSVISAKMKIFDKTDDVSVVVKPSEIGKSGALTLRFNIDTKNL